MMRGDTERGAFNIWTDASGSFGCGAWNPATGEWLHLGWDQLQDEAGEGLGQESITFLELLPIELACGR